MSNTKGLKSLGSKKTKYNFDKPNPKLLENFDNKHLKTPYLIPFEQVRDEFTSLCPKTGQPDHAKMEIIYVPDKLCVESKSLKLYLMSFRNSGEFHEDVCNRIANDLVKLLNPLYLRVYGDFASRGGLAIKPLIERWDYDKLDKIHTNNDIYNMVQMWDIKK